ncbi:hypothetical protein V2J09_000014 [Rumex salicifolius]
MAPLLHIMTILLSLPLILLLPTAKADELGVGINYGQIANNLPSPSQVASLLRSLNVNRVKLYDSDPLVLSAFASSSPQVDFTVGLGNEYLSNLTEDVSFALHWIRTRILPYLNRTRISSITVGNEVFSGNDTRLMSLLLPAMESVYSALTQLGLSAQVSVTTAHATSILGTSYPPSSGSFRPDLAGFIKPILSFHSTVKSPFLLNAYPFFAYMGDPGRIPLDYVLFRPNSGMTDPNTNLHYDNMLYAQIDAVYSAIKAMGHTDIEIRVSETGWPSRGDPDEVGATPQNAAAYNKNLLTRIRKKEGTPAKPSVPIDVYVFALFNENLKPGPSSERNYGLYYPNGSPVYDIGLRGYLPVYTTAYSSNAHTKSTDVYIRVVLSSWVTIKLLRDWVTTM